MIRGLFISDPMNIKKVVLIGAGNVAVHLGQALSNAGIKIIQVAGRSEAQVEELAGQLACSYTLQPHNLKIDADIYILAVNDESYGKVLEEFPLEGKFLIHTSGSLPIDMFKEHTKNYGCIYPLQSFSREQQVDLQEVPLFIEGSNDKSADALYSISGMISKRVVSATGFERTLLHLAAVFANNFVNHLYTLASDLLDHHALSFEHLEPLIRMTTQKVLASSPMDVQTGPAVRNDTIIIKKHLELLNFSPEMKKLYAALSEDIQKRHHKP